MSDSVPDKTILLVEDEAIIAMAEAAVLKKNGYAVITAGNAEKAGTGTKEGAASFP